MRENQREVPYFVKVIKLFWLDDTSKKLATFEVLSRA